MARGARRVGRLAMSDLDIERELERLEEWIRDLICIS
jgi:hypothetical protein